MNYRIPTFFTAFVIAGAPFAGADMHQSHAESAWDHGKDKTESAAMISSPSQARHTSFRHAGQNGEASQSQVQVMDAEGAEVINSDGEVIGSFHGFVVDLVHGDAPYAFILAEGDTYIVPTDELMAAFSRNDRKLRFSVAGIDLAEMPRQTDRDPVRAVQSREARKAFGKMNDSRKGKERSEKGETKQKAESVWAFTGNLDYHAIFTSDGQYAGTVGDVVVDTSDYTIDYILMTEPDEDAEQWEPFTRTTGEYFLIGINHVEGPTDGEDIRISATHDDFRRASDLEGISISGNFESTFMFTSDS